MSFILDALKKLEREKDTREPGVVMVGPVPWGGRDRRRRGVGLTAATAVLLVALGGALLWLRSGPESPPPGGAGEGTEVPSAPAGPPVAGTASEPEVTPLDASSAGRSRPPAVAPTAPPPLERTVTPVPEAPPVAGDEPGTEPADGTAPAPSTAPASAPEFRLTAISSRDGHPIALLNDRLVREGDSFDGITVVTIGETSIEIEVNGERRIIGF